MLAAGTMISVRKRRMEEELGLVSSHAAGQHDGMADEDNEELKVIEQGGRNRRRLTMFAEDNSSARRNNDVLRRLDDAAQGDSSLLYLDGLREKVYFTFQGVPTRVILPPPWPLVSLCVALTSLIMISVSCTVLILQTVQDVARQPAAGTVLFTFESTTVIWFVLDYIIRCSTSHRRLRFIIRPTNLIDLLSLAPYAIDFFVDGEISALSIIRVVRLVRVLRAFRMAKASRFSEGLKDVVTAVSRSGPALSLLFVMLLAAVLILATLMFYAENAFASFDPKHRLWILQDGQVSPYQSILHTTWYCMTSLTTVGYGDAEPKTGLARFVGSVGIVSGVLVIAFPTVILSATFHDVYTSRIIANTVRIVAAREAAKNEKQRTALRKRVKKATEVDIDGDGDPDCVREFVPFVNPANLATLPYPPNSDTADLAGSSLPSGTYEGLNKAFDLDFASGKRADALIRVLFSGGGSHHAAKSSPRRRRDDGKTETEDHDKEAEADLEDAHGEATSSDRLLRLPLHRPPLEAVIAAHKSHIGKYTMRRGAETAARVYLDRVARGEIPLQDQSGVFDAPSLRVISTNMSLTVTAFESIMRRGSGRGGTEAEALTPAVSKPNDERAPPLEGGGLLPIAITVGDNADKEEVEGEGADPLGADVASIVGTNRPPAAFRDMNEAAQTEDVVFHGVVFYAPVLQFACVPGTTALKCYVTKLFPEGFSFRLTLLLDSEVVRDAYERRYVGQRVQGQRVKGAAMKRVALLSVRVALTNAIDASLTDEERDQLTSCYLQCSCFELPATATLPVVIVAPNKPCALTLVRHMEALRFQFGVEFTPPQVFVLDSTAHASVTTFVSGDGASKELRVVSDVDAGSPASPFRLSHLADG